MEHKCHARGCTVEVPSNMLMCKPHWFSVPLQFRKDVWRLYNPGQEIKKKPTKKYVEAARKAIQAVARKEGKV